MKLKQRLKKWERNFGEPLPMIIRIKNLVLKYMIVIKTLTI